jgi:hypothetical protein
MVILLCSQHRFGVKSTVAELLIQRGEDAASRDNSGWTPLYAASRSGHVKMAELLIRHGADSDVSSPHDKGRTPLHAASYGGHVKMAEWLIQHGADMSSRDNIWFNPFAPGIKLGPDGCGRTAHSTWRRYRILVKITAGPLYIQQHSGAVSRPSSSYSNVVQIVTYVITIIRHLWTWPLTMTNSKLQTFYLDLLLLQKKSLTRNVVHPMSVNVEPQSQPTKPKKRK